MVNLSFNLIFKIDLRLVCTVNCLSIIESTTITLLVGALKAFTPANLHFNLRVALSDETSSESWSDDFGRRVPIDVIIVILNRVVVLYSHTLEVTLA